MNELLLIVWPLVMAAYCWLLRRAGMVPILAAIVTTLVECGLLLRASSDGPARLMGMSVVLSGVAALVFGLFAVVLLVSLLAASVGAGKGYLPTAGLLMLSSGAGIALLVTPLVEMLLLLLAGLALVVAVLDQAQPATAWPFRAAVVSLVLVVVGATLLFAGALLVGAVPGQHVALAMVVLGWAVLLGLTPFHLWLTDITGQAPLSVVGLVIGGMQFLVVLLVVSVLQLQPEWVANVLTQQLLQFFGMVTVLIAAVLAFNRSPRQSFAALVIARWGLIVVGLATAHPAGVAGALALLVGQLLGVGLLVTGLSVLEAPAAAQSEGARRWGTVGTIAGILTVIGAPPFAGWLPLALLLTALQRAPTVLLVGVLGIIVAAVAGVGLCARVWTWQGGPATRKGEIFHMTRSARIAGGLRRGTQYGTIALLIITSLGAGIWPNLVLGPLTSLVAALPFVGAG